MYLYSKSQNDLYQSLEAQSLKHVGSWNSIFAHAALHLIEVDKMTFHAYYQLSAWGRLSRLFACCASILDALVMTHMYLASVCFFETFCPHDFFQHLVYADFCNSSFNSISPMILFQKHFSDYFKTKNNILRNTRSSGRL